MLRSSVATCLERVTFLAAAVTFGVSCGASRHDRDAGVWGRDAEVDAPNDGVDAATDGGDAAPPQEGCEDWMPDGARACVPSGPFLFGWVVDESMCPTCPPEALAAVRSRALASGNDLAHIVETGVFLIDLREVSIREYADYIAETGAPPPPAACEHVYYRYLGCKEVSTRTGWTDDGQPQPEWLDLPVTCVTQQEAESYCSWRGGSLPDTSQWMKAARGPLPNKREYPWSEDQPPPWTGGARLDSGMIAYENEEPFGEDWCAHAADLRPPEPVDSHREWASPYGLVNLIANATEWVRVAATGDGYERSRIDVMNEPFTSESVLSNGGEGMQISFGKSAALTLDPERTGAVLRERTLGFRCAYPY